MCKYKDTDLGIKKLDFGQKRGMMAVYLTDGRVVLVPVSMFPDIKNLSRKQREEWMVLDDQYFTFFCNVISTMPLSPTPRETPSPSHSLAGTPPAMISI